MQQRVIMTHRDGTPPLSALEILEPIADGFVQLSVWVYFLAPEQSNPNVDYRPSKQFEERRSSATDDNGDYQRFGNLQIAIEPRPF
jgi:hypothetical protein